MTNQLAPAVERRKAVRGVAAMSYTLQRPKQNDKIFTSLADLIVALNEQDLASKQLRSSASARDVQVVASDGTSYAVLQTDRQAPGGVRLYIRVEVQSVQIFFDQTIASVARYACDALGLPRKPWQMRGREWGAIRAIYDIACGYTPVLDPDIVQKATILKDGRLLLLRDYVKRVFNSIGVGPSSYLLSDGSQSTRHADHVAHALVSGKDIPKEVLAEYSNPSTWPHDSQRWFGACMKQPFLRGTMDYRKLDKLLAVLQDPYSEIKEITKENLPQLQHLMGTLPNSASLREVADVLFKADILRMQDAAPQHTAPLGEPVNSFATFVRNQIIADMTNLQQACLKQTIADRNLTKRDIAYWVRDIASIPNNVGFAFANRLAIALRDKDMDELLDMLDRPEGVHTACKSAVERTYGITLRNTTPYIRRRAIFTAMGFVSEQSYLDAEAAHQVRQAQKSEAATQQKQETSLAKAVKLLSSKVFNYQGKSLNGVDFIDALWADGYTELKKDQRGGGWVYRLASPQGAGYLLSAGDGTLSYALSLIAQHAQRGCAN